MYYLRSTAAADAIKFTLDKSAITDSAMTEANATSTAEHAAKQPMATVVETQQAIPYDSRTQVSNYEQKMSDMACSLDNPDACEACGS